METKRNWALTIMWSVLMVVDFVVFTRILNRPHMELEYIVLALGFLLCANGISGSLMARGAVHVQTSGSPFWRMFDRNFMYPPIETLPYSRRRVVWQCCTMILSGALVGSTTFQFIERQDWIALLVGVLAALNALNSARQLYLMLPADHAIELTQHTEEA